MVVVAVVVVVVLLPELSELSLVGVTSEWPARSTVVLSQLAPCWVCSLC